MIIENISDKQIVIANGLGEGRTLSIDSGAKSPNIVPSKNLLGILIRRNKDLRMTVNNSKELEMLAELDPRVASFITIQ